MSVSQIISTKLKGTENYALWALRMTAYLRRQGLKDIIETDEVSDEINENALADIELCLEDGPLLQIQHIKRAHILWLTLKNLYTPKGFSADFFVIKEFFICKLSNFNNMEEFLYTSCRLLDSMQQRGIELPKKVIFTQYLNNLSNNYENIVSNIMQTLRNNFYSYTLDELFSNFNDENLLMSHEELPLISYEDCNIDYNVSQVTPITVLNLQSADMSSDVINEEQNAMLRYKSTKFVFDTAATRHIVCDKRLLTNFQDCSTIVKWGNAKSIQVSGMGDMFLRFKNNTMLFKLQNCMYMPQLGFNIISHPQIRGNYTSVFNKDTCQILCKGKVIAHGRRENNLFCLDVDQVVI
ncbi:hypothetical protein OnM2_078049, partial [Erysiphe neolycopersici]